MISINGIENLKIRAEEVLKEHTAKEASELIKELNLYQNIPIQNRHPNQSENLSLQIDQNLKQSFVVVMDH